MRRNFQHLDAGESIFLQRQLQQIMTKLYMQPFGPFKAQQLIPYRFDIDPGAESYGYDRIIEAGAAQWLASGANDLPRAVVKKTRVLVPMRSIGVSYGWTVQEIRAAKFANQPLSDLDAKAARTAVDAFRNQKHMLGDTSVSWTGFINDPSITVANATNGAWANSTTSGDKMLQDLNDATTAIWAGTLENYRANTIALPPQKLARLQTGARGASTDTTILKYFQANYDGPITFVSVPELAGAGVGATDRMVVYQRDEEVLEAAVPILFNQEPPDQEGFQISVACEGRIGPMHWRVPIAARYIDGI